MKPTPIWQTTCLETASSMIVIPVGVDCYFGSSNKEKFAKLSTVKHKASINARQYVMISPHPPASGRHGVGGIRVQNYENILVCANKSDFFARIRYIFTFLTFYCIWIGVCRIIVRLMAWKAPFEWCCANGGSWKGPRSVENADL